MYCLTNISMLCPGAIALPLMPDRNHTMDRLLIGSLVSERQARATLQATYPGTPDEGAPPLTPEQPIPTDVPVPEPFDVPVPNPSDVPPPGPRDVPPPDPNPIPPRQSHPKKDSRPRSVP